MGTELLTPEELTDLDASEQRARRVIRQRLCEEFAPIVANPQLALLMDELIEVAQMVEGIEAEPQSVRMALFHLRHARGPHATHAAWQELAAAALVMADRVRPRTGR